MGQDILLLLIIFVLMYFCIRFRQMPRKESDI